MAIVGPSGSGKSTLMNIIGCLDRPSAGSYVLAGTPVAGLDDDELARLRSRDIGFVFQSYNLLSRTSAIDNVATPLLYQGVGREERYERAKHSLEALGLGDRLHHLPSELSGGQQQRVAIARALVTDPAIILADEPTGNLDSASGVEVMARFHALHEQGRTIVLITHDHDVAAQAPRQIHVRDGRSHEHHRARPARPLPARLVASAGAAHDAGHHHRRRLGGRPGRRWPGRHRRHQQEPPIPGHEPADGQRGCRIHRLHPGCGRLGDHAHGRRRDRPGSALLVSPRWRRNCPRTSSWSPVARTRRPVSLAPTRTTRRSATTPSGQGSFLNGASVDAGLRVAVIGSGHGNDPWSDGRRYRQLTIKIGGLPFELIGILQAKGSSGPLSNDDIVLIPHLPPSSTTSTTRTSIRSIAISVATADQMDTVKATAPRCSGSATASRGRHRRLQHRRSGPAAGVGGLHQLAADHPAGRHRVHLADRRRHRDHEHHARVGPRADPRDRHPQGHRCSRPRHPRPVPGRGTDPLGHRRSHRGRAGYRGVHRRSARSPAGASRSSR